MNIFTIVFFKTNLFFNLILEGLFITLSIIFSRKILKIHFSRKNIIIFTIANLICFALGHIIHNYMIGFALTIFITAIFFAIKTKFSQALILPYICIKSILIFTIEICTIKALNIAFSANSYLEIMQFPICGIIVLTLISLFEFAILKFINKQKSDYALSISLGKNSKTIFYSSIINLIIVFSTTLFFHNILLENLHFLLYLDLYFYFSISGITFYCYKSYKNKQIHDLQNYNDSITNMYDDTRAFKHDFDNIIQAIGGYVSTKDIEGLTKYYSQISSDCKNNNNLCKLNTSVINNPAIYSILSKKYDLANKYNIKLNIDVMMDLNNLHAKIYELTRIFGILMDNAIEASKECHYKKINVSFKQDKYKQIVTIENTYSDKNLSIDKIFEKNYTTKPNNTGLGLWEVNKILNRNSNLNLHTNKDENYFSQQLEIYNS